MRPAVRSTALAAGVPLLCLLLAGCLGAPEGSDLVVDPPFDPQWSEKALAYGDGHDHADPAHHDGLTTRNFRVVGHEPMVSAHYGANAGGYLCGDAKETSDGRRLAAVESRSDVGFAVVDVTDPAAPRWLGELVMPTTRIYDLAVAVDGRHVILVMSESDPNALVPAGATAAPLGTWRTACGEAPLRWAAGAEPDPVPRPASVLLVDIADPADPQIVDQRPLTGLGHGAFATEQDGAPLFLVASVAGGPLRDTFQFYTLLDTPLGARLHLLSTYAPDGPALDTAIGGHTDGWIATHPGTGQHLAYVVGAMGLHLLDVADPTAPRLVGAWTDAVPGRSGPVGNLHSVAPMTSLRDGRHYTVLGPEFQGHPDGQPSGTVWVLDTTDPAAPRAVAAWTLPHEVDWTSDGGPYLFSNHYLAVHGDTAFVSMYHGGVWALDLAGLGGDFHLLPSVGAFLPTLRPPGPVAEPVRWAPTTQEVLAFDDGTLVTFDSNSGLYAFRFDAGDPAPPPAPWPIEPVP